MFSHSVILAAVATVCFTANQAIASPLEARQATCKLESTTIHTTGGGGPGQAPINSYSATFDCFDSAGKFVFRTDQSSDGFKAITTVATAANCGYPGDVTLHTTYDSAANHYNSCTYDFGDSTGSPGEVTDTIDSGTVSVSSTTCTFSIPC